VGKLPGIKKMGHLSAGYCWACDSATMVNYLDSTVRAYVCPQCAPQAILIDALLAATTGVRHPKHPSEVPNN